ncbi:MAG: zinc-binding dehydrogenase [Planctomycetes bacterium]|nr:zinc-binding dehydrogenase [Planctomycetota bacterium]
MAPAIPDAAKALVLPDYNLDHVAAVRSLRVEERAVPSPGPGQVLVRVEAAACNPSDIIFLTGNYATPKELPTAPGWEGAGTVVAAGPGLFGRFLRGRRVAFGSLETADGSWGEYCLTEAARCIPLAKDVSTEQAADLIVNPMSVMGMFGEARRGGHRAAISTAAASQLGRMMVALAKREGYPIIHTVRRPEQAELIRSLGAEHVLDSSTPSFEEDLAAKAKELKATIAFDAIAGESPAQLLAAMPPRSKVLVYGVLAGVREMPMDLGPVLSNASGVEGFYLVHWMEQAGPLRLLSAARKVQRLFADGTFQTQIARRVSLDDAVGGIEAYMNDMTAGKTLICP